MNKVILTGNLTKDIELKYTQSGTAVGKGTIAVKRSFKDTKTQEYITDFFSFVVMGKQAETCGNYMKKGDRVAIEGSLQNRVWEKDDGTKQYFTEVFVSGFDLPVRQSGGQQQTKQEAPKQTPKPKAEFDLPGLDIEDSLPF